MEHLENKKHHKLGVNSDVDDIYRLYILFVDKVMYFSSSTRSFSESWYFACYFITCVNEKEINEVLVAVTGPIANKV